MKNFIKHVSVWIFVVLAGVVSVYVAAQASSVSIEANIGSFIQYIGSLFVTSNGTPSGQPIVSIDTDGLSLYDLTRENAWPWLVGVNTAGQVVMTRPLSYVTLPATTTVQELENNHAYIVPYWDVISETNVVLPSTCIIGDQIEIYAMQLPLNMDTLWDMRIVAAYFESNDGWLVWYGYGDNNTFIEHESYFFSDKLWYRLTDWFFETGVWPDYPYDRCESIWNPDTSNSISTCWYWESPSGYWWPILFAPKKVSFLCIDDYRYLMHFDYIPINTLWSFYAISPNSWYGDKFWWWFPTPYGYDY
jgi:hypothetical protein